MQLGWTAADTRRVVWTLVQAALAVVIAAGIGWANGGAWDWKAVAVGAIAAVLSAIKNLLLADSSPVK